MEKTLSKFYELLNNKTLIKSIRVLGIKYILQFACFHKFVTKKK